MSVFTNSASGAPGQAKQYVEAILDLLGDRDPVDVLGGTPRALRSATGNLSLGQMRQPEAEGKWSIAQAMQHLADSELVSGYRLRLVLAEDRPRVTGYDQDSWASRLGYDRADPDAALERFSVLRRSNLALLQSASAADWKRVGIHSERGEESLELMVRLMAGHDLLHIRQIERIRGAIGAAR